MKPSGTKTKTLPLGHRGPRIRKNHTVLPAGEHPQPTSTTKFLPFSSRCYELVGWVLLAQEPCLAILRHSHLGVVMVLWSQEPCLAILRLAHLGVFNITCSQKPCLATMHQAYLGVFKVWCSQEPCSAILRQAYIGVLKISCSQTYRATDRHNSKMFLYISHRDLKYGDLLKSRGRIFLRLQ
ncbi:hypothetical protein AVEN_105915-1 [Araneus ventricosus]|uniref:Uncharacterized protein n=1 Tax=Araneus ventricosus TaxID=182803 RepID=A0A4Y2THG2_ARAVE|nr:hypothetical protein AVEN_105915-1 [Araneus ventricosus]